MRARVNDNLKMEFTGEGLTSSAGLELLMRYLRTLDWNRQLRRHLGTVASGGDFGVVSLCRVILGLLVVGGRRLRHLDFLKGDPLLQRFCGLTDLPTDRSVSGFLRRFTADGQEALKALNADVVAGKISLLRARKLTIDVDGTVLCTGKRVGGARRGVNPHHRKVPSYYPITAYLANFQIETGLTKRNRTLKNTNRWPLKSIGTLRFELINRARVYSQVHGSASLATTVAKCDTCTRTRPSAGHTRDEADPPVTVRPCRRNLVHDSQVCILKRKKQIKT